LVGRGREKEIPDSSYIDVHFLLGRDLAFINAEQPAVDCKLIPHPRTI
jgi:hypothetical protein